MDSKNFLFIKCVFFLPKPLSYFNPYDDFVNIHILPEPGAPEFFSRGAKFEKKVTFLLKRHCQQKQILVVKQHKLFDFNFNKQHKLSDLGTQYSLMADIKV